MADGNTANNDLIADITILKDLIVEKATKAGIARYLLNGGEVSVRPHDRFDGSNVADISIGFQPNLGLDHELTAQVSDRKGAARIDTKASRDAIAEHFVENMRVLAQHAQADARNRSEIRRAAQAFFDEVAEEGFELELLRIQPSPVHVFGSPRQGVERRKVFYVHVLMPHEDEGTLTRDAWTIDADDAEGFGLYLRDRVLDDMRGLRARLGEPVTA